MTLRLAVWALIVSLAGPALGQPAAALQKIAPWVLQQTDGGRTAEYLLVLAEQVDLSPAALLRTKTEKGRFVYERLFRQAQHTQAPILADLRARGVEHRPYYVVNAIWVKGDRALAALLAERSDIARIDGNPRVRVDAGVRDGPDDTSAGRVAAVEKGLAYVRAPEVWALGFTGRNVVVGGMDSGARWTHNALRPHYRGWNGASADHDFNWHDAVHSGGGPCGSDATEPCDDADHGSHTMGTAVGDDLLGNQIGMAPGAKWIACRNQDQGNGTPASYLECLEWMLAPYPIGGSPAAGDPTLAPDVTVNSWGCPASEGCNAGNWETMRLALAAQRAAGIAGAAAAGNFGSACSSINHPPAMFDESYSVAALNCSAACSDSVPGFSSRGPVTVDGSNRVKPDLAAPGTQVRSSSNFSDATYAANSGTSVAAPHVAGAMALLLSAVPSLKGDVAALENRLSETAVRNAVTSTTVCSSSAGVYPNNLNGHGRLDVLCAVRGNLVNVSIGVAGSTSIGGGEPCLGGTATVTDTDGGTTTHEWGYRTTPGGAFTPIAGQTGTSYTLHCGNFPAMGTFLLVERTTPQCGAVTFSNEVSVAVNATPVELQQFEVE